MEADRRRNFNLKSVIIDTNVLIYIFTHRVDVFSQLRELGFRRFIFPEQTIEELKKLQLSLDGLEKRAAKFALTLIENCSECEIFRVDAEGNDNAILKLAKMFSSTVITNDKRLRKRAKLEGIPVGYLRELRYVEVEDDF
ncbi:PIN domain-containing protein [Geoglobus acetivorans]|uniref:PIN domain-containing protein n=1 Tax=Geoglobus acetivorans TaxID=565033 RepID=A0ABZ3H353_GEOAI|nr:ribonuclease VapC [Geoglobus acetivorans]